MRLNKLWLIFSTVAAATALLLGLSSQGEANEVQIADLEKSTIERDMIDFSFDDIQEAREDLPDYRSSITLSEWRAADEAADAMYEDSEGVFKKEWGLFLASEALHRDIDPFLVYELLRVETGDQFDPEMVGPQTRYGRAYGIAQFMTNTAPWIAEMAGIEYEEEKLFDPYYSMFLSVEYLDFLYDRYDDWNHALTAYHRGIYGMETYVDQNGHAESWYAVEIQEKADHTGSLVTYNQ